MTTPLTPGEERIISRSDGRVELEYLTENGAHFSCLAPSVEDARRELDEWRARRGSRADLKAWLDRRVAERGEEMEKKPGFAAAVKRNGLKTPEEIKAYRDSWALAALLRKGSEESPEEKS